MLSSDLTFHRCGNLGRPEMTPDSWMPRRGLLVGLGGISAGMLTSGLMQADALHRLVQSDSIHLRGLQFEAAGERLTMRLYATRLTPASRAWILAPGARGFPADPQIERWAQRLALTGDIVLLADYYQAAPGEVVRQLATLDKWVAVIAAAAAALRANRLSPAGIVALGYSLGGYVVLEAAISSAEIDSVIAVAAGEDVERLRTSGRAPKVMLLEARSDTVVSHGSVNNWASRLARLGIAVERRRLRHAGHGLDDDAWAETFAIAQGFAQRGSLDRQPTT